MKKDGELVLLLDRRGHKLTDGQHRLAELERFLLETRENQGQRTGKKNGKRTAKAKGN